MLLSTRLKPRFSTKRVVARVRAEGCSMRIHAMDVSVVHFEGGEYEQYRRVGSKKKGASA